MTREETDNEILWFEALLDSIADGEIEDAVKAIKAAISLKRREKSVLKNPENNFATRAKQFRTERFNAWFQFLELSATAGYAIENNLANRCLFMAGYESGKEANASKPTC